MRKLITGPSVEPLTLAETRNYLKIDSDNTTDDLLIADLIQAARERAEKYMKRSLITTVWDEYMDEFPDTIVLYTCPLQSVTSITYYDSDGDSQTLATTVWVADVVSEPARIALRADQAWPDTYDQINSVVIRYESGYGDSPDDVPEAIRSGMLVHVGHLYENRQDVTKEKMNELPMGSQSLYDNYRVY